MENIMNYDLIDDLIKLTKEFNEEEIEVQIHAV